MLSYNDSIFNYIHYDNFYLYENTSINNSGFRLCRSLLFFKYLSFPNLKVEKYVSDFFKKLRLPISLGLVLLFALKLLIMIHISNCFWISFAYDNQTNWIVNIGLENGSYTDLYVSACYFVLSTIFTVGYGDIKSVNFKERLFNTFLMVFGIFFYTLAVSSLSSYVYKQGENEKIYDELIVTLEELKTKFNLKPSYMLKVKTFLNQRLIINNEDISQLLKDLPLSIRRDFLFTMYQDEMLKFRFLNRIYNKDILIQVLLLLKSQSFNRNDYIIEEKKQLDEMIFVKRGKITLEKKINISKLLEGNIFDFIKSRLDLQNEKKRTISKYKTIKILQLRRFDYYGDSLILSEKKSPVSLVVSSKIAEIFTLSRMDLNGIILTFKDQLSDSLYSSTENIELLTQLIELKIKKKKDILLKHYENPSIYNFQFEFIDINKEENDEYSHDEIEIQETQKDHDSDNNIIKNKIAYTNDTILDSNINQIYKENHTHNELEALKEEDREIYTNTFSMMEEKHTSKEKDMKQVILSFHQLNKQKSKLSDNINNIVSNTINLSPLISKSKEIKCLKNRIQKNSTLENPIKKTTLNDNFLSIKENIQNNKIKSSKIFSKTILMNDNNKIKRNELIENVKKFKHFLVNLKETNDNKTITNKKSKSLLFNKKRGSRFSQRLEAIYNKRIRKSLFLNQETNFTRNNQICNENSFFILSEYENSQGSKRRVTNARYSQLSKLSNLKSKNSDLRLSPAKQYELNDPKHDIKDSLNTLTSIKKIGSFNRKQNLNNSTSRNLFISPNKLKRLNAITSVEKLSSKIINTSNRKSINHENQRNFNIHRSSILIQKYSESPEDNRKNLKDNFENDMKRVPNSTIMNMEIHKSKISQQIAEKENRNNPQMFLQNFLNEQLKKK